LFASLPLFTHSMIGWEHDFGDVDPTALVSESGIDWRFNSQTTLGAFYSGQPPPTNQTPPSKENSRSSSRRRLFHSWRRRRNDGRLAFPKRFLAAAQRLRRPIAGKG
jgi:hypothetical protein